MKRSVLVLFTLFTLSCAQAQDLYFGVRADVVYAPTVAPDISVVVPLPAIQLGFPVFDNVELRTSLITLLFFNLLQLDVLYTEKLSGTLRGYGGVGGDVGSDIFSGGEVVGVHATAGLEYQVGSGIGLFGELQPLYILQAPNYFLGGDADSALGLFAKLNLGINFHF